MHALDQFCALNNIVHYLIDPGKPAQNGTVERSHREDQEKFYEQNGFKNLDDLERKLKVWNTYYNNLEHCGLGGKTPNEFLEDYKLIKPPENTEYWSMFSHVNEHIHGRSRDNTVIYFFSTLRLTKMLHVRA